MKSSIFFRSAIAMTAILLAACGDSQPEAEPAMMPVEPDGGIGDGAPALSDTVDGDIPAALHGRWGLVPADCTSDRGDAKGLIVVDAQGIKFYESRGSVGEVAESDDRSIRASFAFTGEGQEWVRDMQLALSADGAQLIRREFGNDALQAPLIYRKCEA